MENKISVIVPVYNGEKNIDETLRSIRNQTYENIEIIVVNDGSMDRTAEKVQKHIDEDSRVSLYSQENSGVSVARNVGIKKSTGQFISFLDADDTFVSNYLEEMLNKINQGNYDYVYCGYNTVLEGEIKPKVIKFTKKDLLLNYILNKTHPQTSCWLIRNDFLKRNNILFPSNVNWSEDIEFYTKVITSSDNYSYVDQYLINYHIDPDEERLSSFSIDKMDLDFESMSRIAKRDSMNDPKIQKAIYDYRLNALLTFRLYEAIKEKEEREDILKYYNKYKDIITSFSFMNGLRSIKLNMVKIKIKRKLRLFVDGQ